MVVEPEGRVTEVVKVTSLVVDEEEEAEAALLQDLSKCFGKIDLLRH